MRKSILKEILNKGIETVKNGTFIVREVVDERTIYTESCPIFTQNREIIEDLIKATEE
jgi:hypothetical protein